MAASHKNKNKNSEPQTQTQTTNYFNFFQGKGVEAFT